MDKKWFLIWLIRAGPIYVKLQNSAGPTPQRFVLISLLSSLLGKHNYINQPSFTSLG